MIASIVNFRDFGGWESRFGGRIADDRLYRSGAIATVSGSDTERLLGLDFALIADLRYAGERESEPSPWPLVLAERVVTHGGARSAEAPHMAPLRDGTLDEEGSDRLYHELYRSLPFDPLYRPLFTRILSALPAVDGRLLVHCSAGKDRTGMTVALIHHALGVLRADIVADFMKSSSAPGLLAMAEPLAARMSKKFGRTIRPELMRRLLDVQESFLHAFFDEIEDRSGSVDAYLDSVGLDETGRQRLRERLLT